jgi:hypothetical protein
VESTETSAAVRAPERQTTDPHRVDPAEDEFDRLLHGLDVANDWHHDPEPPATEP